MDALILCFVVLLLLMLSTNVEPFEHYKIKKTHDCPYKAYEYYNIDDLQEMWHLTNTLDEYQQCENIPLEFDCQGKVYDFVTFKQRMVNIGYPGYKYFPYRIFIELINRRRHDGFGPDGRLSIDEVRRILGVRLRRWKDRRRRSHMPVVFWTPPQY